MKDDKNALIEATYKLVLQTSTYAEFLGTWEASDLLAEEGVAQRVAPAEVVGSDFVGLLEQAIKVLEEVKKIAPTDEELSTLSNSAAAPTAIVSPRGIVVSATDEFTEKMELKAGDQIESLVFSPAESQRLRQGLRSIGEAQPSQLLAMVRTNIPGAGRPGLLSLVAASYETAFLSVSIPQFTEALGSVAANLFGLTEAEVAVLAALIEGVDLQQIASERERSIETVRSQVKSILRKVGAHSQAELVGIFSTIPKFLTAAQGQPLSLAPTETFLTREDGRRVSYTTVGPENGLAVVLCHGMIDGAKLPLGIQALFTSAGIRVITPARPGFGKTDRINNPKQGTATVVADCSAILDFLEIEDCIFIGQMGGAVYACAAAAELGKRVRAVVCVGGTIPIASERQIDAMSRGQRALAMSYRNAPNLSILILRAGIALVRKGQDRRLFDAQFPKESADHEVLHRPENLEAIREGYRFAFDGGHHSHYVDALAILSDWSDVADAIQQPVVCLHGGRDPVTPIGFVREYVELASNRSLVELPDRGQLILYADAAKIVEIVLRLFKG